MTMINLTLKEYLDLNTKYNNFYDIDNTHTSVFYTYTTLFNTFFPEMIHTTGSTTTKIGDLVADIFPARYDDREIVFEDDYPYASFEAKLKNCFLKIMSKKGITKDIIKQQITKMRSDEVTTNVVASVLGSVDTTTDVRDEVKTDTFNKTNTSTLGSVETLVIDKDEDATEANSLASKVTSKETKDYYAPAVSGGTLENAALKGGTSETVTEGLPVVTITRTNDAANTETKTASGGDVIADTGTIASANIVDNTLTKTTSGGDTITTTNTIVKPMSASDIKMMVELENYIEECFAYFEPLFIGVFEYGID